jgi:hypothetical protein
MPRASRELLREYHLSAAGPNILRRKQMAQALDLPLTALRLRVFRLRRQLVKSVNRCLESAPGETK